MTLFKTHVPDQSNLPRRIKRLGELAYNLWWTWNPDAQRLFNRIDNALWERLNHNPLPFLRQVEHSKLKAAARDKVYLEIFDALFREFDAYLNQTDTWFARNHPQWNGRTVAYFSMEYGLHETLPIYSGGLGVLAGDHLKEASDLGLPLVGVGILYSEGYFSQRIHEDGWQEAINNPLDFQELPVLPVMRKDREPLIIQIDFPEGRALSQIWELRLGRTPLYLLDTNMEANPPIFRHLTARLYWSDQSLRIMQEILLGVGGVRAMRELGTHPTVWHMNEGHAAFLILERLNERVAGGEALEAAITATAPQNIFTTHTPVSAGNDEFPFWLADKYLPCLWPELDLDHERFVALAGNTQTGSETFSMGVLALRHSGGRNAVSELHGRVARQMWHFLWPEKRQDRVPILSVTNGVHTTSWMARRLRVLLVTYLGEDWIDRLDDPGLWNSLDAIPDAELWNVRMHLKRKLVFHILERARARWQQGDFHPVQVVGAGSLLDPYVLTIGFARRFATYKRASLILSDPDRLLKILNQPNLPVQIIFAGKAHPADDPGKRMIQEIYAAVKSAENGGRLVFLEDYDINLARYLVQGVDVWMNTPRRPNEASGTSGMKAALNGVLNFSVLDGWWREAYNGRNGWAIGEDGKVDVAGQDRADAESLYAALESEIIPMYYSRRGRDEMPVEWLKRIKESMRTIAPVFSTRRMVKEYLERLYLPAMRQAA